MPSRVTSPWTSGGKRCPAGIATARNPPPRPPRPHQALHDLPASRLHRDLQPQAGPQERGLDQAARRRTRRGDHERMASEVSERRALLPRQLVTTRHDQHSIRREQRLEPQTVRQRLPGPNRQVQLAREQLIERLHVALVSHLESQGRVRLANPSKKRKQEVDDGGLAGPHPHGPPGHLRLSGDILLQSPRALQDARGLRGQPRSRRRQPLSAALPRKEGHTHLPLQSLHRHRHGRL